MPLLLFAIAPGCGHSAVESADRRGAAAEPLPLTTRTLQVELETWPTVVRVQGSLSADEVSTVGAKVAGRVVTVDVDLGDFVQANQSLVTIDRQEFELLVMQARAQLAQARAAVGLTPEDDAARLDPLHAPPVREAKAVWDQAKQEADRLTQLRKQNAVSDAEVDVAEAAEQVADARFASALNGVREKIALISVQTAELSLAEQHLNDSVTRAPFDAVVQNRQVAPGMYVQVGAPLIELVRTSTLRFRGSMPERYAQLLHQGQQVKLRIESLAEPREVRVSRISPALDELSRSLMFEAEVENADQQLRSGLFAEAEVILDPAAQSVVIPRSALVRFAGVEKVWRVADGMAGEAVVQVGRQEADRVEILDGIAVGETILLDGSLGRVAKLGTSPSVPTQVAENKNVAAQQ